MSSAFVKNYDERVSYHSPIYYTYDRLYKHAGDNDTLPVVSAKEGFCGCNKVKKEDKKEGFCGSGCQAPNNCNINCTCKGRDKDCWVGIL